MCLSLEDGEDWEVRFFRFSTLVRATLLSSSLPFRAVVKSPTMICGCGWNFCASISDHLCNTNLICNFHNEFNQFMRYFPKSMLQVQCLHCAWTSACSTPFSRILCTLLFLSSSVIFLHKRAHVTVGTKVSNTFMMYLYFHTSYLSSLPRSTSQWRGWAEHVWGMLCKWWINNKSFNEWKGNY